MTPSLQNVLWMMSFEHNADDEHNADKHNADDEHNADEHNADDEHYDDYEH